MQTNEIKEFYEDQVRGKSVFDLVGMDIDMNEILEDVIETLPEHVRTAFIQKLEGRCAVALYEIEHRWCSDPKYFPRQVSEIFS